MAEITAQKVNELRAKTGQPMMKCKEMLTKTGGDIEKAVEEFRKAGVKTSITERAASEGRVLVAAGADAKAGAIVEVLCNTDFTAKSDPIAQIMRKAVEKLIANPALNAKEDAELKAMLPAAAPTTGENVQLGRFAAQTATDGKIGTYLYNITGKIAVLMNFTGNPSAELIQDLGGHIAFANPLGLTREQVPADLVAKERAIAVEQAKATGKPQQIAEKIAEGKLNAFFAERVLLDQEFFNPGKFKGTIANLLKQNGVSLSQYVRFAVGQ
jgi:elongation factor Ts